MHNEHDVKINGGGDSTANEITENLIEKVKGLPIDHQEKLFQLITTIFGE